MELLDRLNEVFCEVFDDADIKITPEMTANDVDGWDSLSHVNLILAVEAKFKIRFTRAELMTMKNVNDLHNAVLNKLPV
jgi:acyl carrier protein